MSDLFSNTLLLKTKALEASLSREDFGLHQEIEDAPGASTQLEDLRNTLRSLDLYTRSERDVRYIALIGHYSAGKSSTINSLLGEDLRKADLNPTDTGVTYLSHRKNNRKILSAESKGKLKVEVSLIENDLLKDAVVLDTPGTGDPSQVGAMVKDVLPLASVIFYLLSATNPFDDSDVPTMRVVFKDLSHIPIRFIITRSDEFRIDKSKPLSKENLNKEVRDKFGSTVLARLREEGFGIGLTPDDLVYVDNQSGYGISELRHLAFSSEIDSSSIHLNTLNFYVRRISECRDYFLTWSEKIAQSVDGLLEKATTNRDKFDERTSLSSGELSKWWAENHAELVKRSNEDAATFGKLSGSKIELHEISFVNPKGSLDEALGELREDIVTRLTSVCEEYATEAFKRHTRRKIEQYDEAKDWKEFDKAYDFTLLSPADVQVEESIRAALRHLAGRIDDTWNALRDALHSELLILTKLLAELDEALKLNTTIRSEAGRFTSYETTLGKVVESFLATVQLYRTTVLSYRTRELTGQISVGRALDELDEFILSDAERSEILSTFNQTIFSGRSEVLDAFEGRRQRIRQATADMGHHIEQLQESFRVASVGLPTRFNLASMCESKISKEQIQIGLMQIIRGALVEEANTLNQKVEDAIALEQQQKNEVAQATLERRSKVVQSTVIAILLLGLLGSAVIWISDINKYLGTVVSFAVSGLLSIVAPSIAAAVGWQWKTQTDSEGSLAGKKSAKNILMNSRDELSIKLSNTSVAELIESSFILDLRNECALAYARAIESFERFNTNLNQQYKELSRIARIHGNDHAKTMGLIQAWYEPSAEKSALLQAMANAIKDRSIEPSFDILRQKKASVDAAVKELRELKIDLHG